MVLCRKIQYNVGGVHLLSTSMVFMRQCFIRIHLIFSYLEIKKIEDNVTVKLRFYIFPNGNPFSRIEIF